MDFVGVQNKAVIMLILTLKTGQSVEIDLERDVSQGIPVEEFFADGPIQIFVAQVKGRRVKLGITVHPDFAIRRSEISPE